MKVTLINSTPNALETIYIAGKICRYKSFEEEILPLLQDKSNIVGFIETLIKAGHESLLEHVSYSFLIENISRNATHQLVRHRISSFSQYSHRKADEKLKMVVPPGVNGEMLQKWTKACDTLGQLYANTGSNGVSWDEARYILPGGITTSIMWTINTRSLRNFFKLRLAKSASWEIQELANTVFCIVWQLHPYLFADFKDLSDSTKVQEYSLWSLNKTKD